MSSTDSPVRVRVEDGVGVVTLAGDHANAVDPDLVLGLRRAYRELAADPAVGAVLLRAEGKLLAGRIISTVKPGYRLARGERIGMICFGSRVDLYLPPECAIMVKIGDRV